MRNCSYIQADRAYVDLRFLYGLSERGVFFVLREKENMVFKVLERRQHKDPRILADETVRMSRKGSDEKYPQPPANALPEPPLKSLKSPMNQWGKGGDVRFLPPMGC